MLKKYLKKFDYLCKNTYMKEIFKEVKGYNGKYQISNFGTLRSMNYNRTGLIMNLSYTRDKDGYNKTNLSNKGKLKSVRIHRLVAETFSDYSKDQIKKVSHIDGDILNNHLTNLKIILF